MFKRALTLICCSLLFATFSVRADEWNKKTVVTFSGPVELPGIVLPAGTYVFKLLDSESNRHIVQVFNKDETKIYTTILAIPNYRLAPTGETVIRFSERPKGTPEAMRAWFYPGDNFGQEFVYPKTRAITLAAEVKEPVLAAPVTRETKPEELATAPVETIAPPPVEAKRAPPEAIPAPAVEPAPPPEAAPVAELPKTASSIPLVALLGTAALLFALVLKRLA
ncbi:MAG TPA: hypothetical protein VMB85_19820 [Bryobacteraceae bacterium]|nr:hypothetical protein [Bryobacteraceae bacterium]